MSEPRMIRGWIHVGDWDAGAGYVCPDEWENHRPVVVVPAAYVDAVEALAESVLKIEAFVRLDPDTTSTRFILHNVRAALQQYREATEGDEA